MYDMYVVEYIHTYVLYIRITAGPRPLGRADILENYCMIIFPRVTIS